jgi:hypothetical protein
MDAINLACRPSRPWRRNAALGVAPPFSLVVLATAWAAMGGELYLPGLVLGATERRLWVRSTVRNSVAEATFS